jgi:hypothetical protein
MKKSPTILLVALTAIMIAGCTAPPTEEMNKAADAVTRAENDVNAVAYAGPVLSRAREALNQMQSEAASKRYDSAKSYSAEAITAAEKAISDGKIAADRARNEAVELLRTLDTEIAQTEGELAASKEVPGIILDFAPLDADLAAAKSAYTDANASLSAARYAEAVTKAQPIRPLLAGIRTGLSQAAMTAVRKK